MILAEYFKNTYPPKPTFAVDDIPDMAGKVVLITGGSAGIGRETASVLLARNAKVYIACRPGEKAKAAVADLKNASGKGEIYLLPVDLANLASIRKAADEFNSKETHLHVLFNNAGVMAAPIEQLTADGYDLQFGTNVLGHFLLTTLLLPALTAAAGAGGEARVVTTSSLAHWLGPQGSIVWDTLRPEKGGAGEKARVRLGTEMMYNQSKCGNILFAKELTRRYGDQGIVSTSLNPGNIVTELGRHIPPLRHFLIKTFVKLYPVPLGALTQLYAGTAPEAAKLNGQFLIPWARVAECRTDENNAEVAGRLWTWMEEQVAVPSSA